MKTALVCGAGGFIGGHLVKKLKREGYWVRGVDIKAHEFAPTQADEFLLLDLREEENCQHSPVLEKKSNSVKEPSMRCTSWLLTWEAWASSTLQNARSCTTAP